MSGGLGGGESRTPIDRLVAHRLSTIRHADLVRVLDQGRVIERGTHAELLTLRGHYAALYRRFVQIDERDARDGSVVRCKPKIAVIGPAFLL
jgi:ABC-type microcin C transport system duplicated ATPase subunit YejF